MTLELYSGFCVVQSGAKNPGSFLPTGLNDGVERSFWSVGTLDLGVLVDW
jgi:hypothetical protein